MPYPTRYFRRTNFSKEKLNGVVFDESKLDPELNDVQSTVQQINDFVRAGFNADKTLKPFTSTDAMDLLSLTRLTATASQTAFTVPTYNTSLDSVIAFADGDFIDTASITKTSTTVVTLPAQPVSTIVIILIFTAGSGTLSRLADTTTVGEGAALVGVRDAGGLYTSTTVEDALAEVAGDLNTLSVAIGTIANYIKKDGSIAFAANQPMGGFKLTGLAAGASNGDSVRYEQLAAVIAQLNGVTSGFLPKTGGTMSGIIDFGAQRAVNVGAPTTGTDATNKTYVDAQLASFGGLPVGSAIPFAGLTTPTGWLLCDGSAVSRATYANLFAALGVTYGVGDGTTTFNVPDLMGRTVIGVGAGSGLTARSLNDAVGTETHVLDVTQIPAHTHSGGLVNSSTSGAGAGSSFGTGQLTGSTGGGLAHPNMQPSRALKYIVKF